MTVTSGCGDLDTTVTRFSSRYEWNSVLSLRGFVKAKMLTPRL